MSAESYVEIERKFDVSGDEDVPPLGNLAPVTEVGPTRTSCLDAVYFDTERLDLASAHITFRRRVGGADEGWHLKLPVSADQREELRLPLGDEHEPPASLVARIRWLVRERPLVPVARIRTVRVVHPLQDDGGQVLAELCDDRVDAERLLSPTSTSQWREWEIELVEGSSTLLKKASGWLLGGGAAPASSGSKLARALGGQPALSLHAAPARPPIPAPPRNAGDLLIAYLGEQLDQLRIQDPRVRLGEPDSVHKMRVAARRARSSLSTYEQLLEPGAGDSLRAELQWLGAVLGEARDAEVLRGRLEGLLEGDPHSPDHAAVAEQIEDELAARFASGTEHAGGLLDSRRYFRLLDSFEGLVGDPPLKKRARHPARRAARRLVKRDWERMAARAETAEAARGAERGLALHDVRKAAKRLRYAAESAVPVLGERAELLATRCVAIQDALGEHHDSTVARDLLRKVHESSDASRRYVLVGLHEREEDRAREHERDYEDALTLLPTAHRGAWLRGSVGG